MQNRGFCQLNQRLENQPQLHILKKETRGIHTVTLCFALFSYLFVNTASITDFLQVVFCRFCGYLAVLQVSLLHELHWVSFESLLAGYAAKMIGLAIVGDLELGCLLVQNDATNGISRHYFNLIEDCAFCLLLLLIKRKRCVKRTEDLAISLISSWGSSFRIAFSAVYGSASVRFEGDLTFLTTIGAYGLVHFSVFSIRGKPAKFGKRRPGSNLTRTDSFGNFISSLIF